MRASHDLTRVAVRFDEACLVPNAGLLPAAALAQRVDLVGLVDTRVRLASEAANSGAKALTVIGSILAGADSIDDTDLLRAGSSGELFDQVRAPRRSGAGYERSSGPTWANSTRSRGSSWLGCGPPGSARPIRPVR